MGIQAKDHLVGAESHGSNSPKAHGEAGWLLGRAVLRTRHLLLHKVFTAQQICVYWQTCGQC